MQMDRENARAQIVTRIAEPPLSRSALPLSGVTSAETDLSAFLQTNTPTPSNDASVHGIFVTPVGGAAKRVFDICFSALAIVIMAPVLLVVAILIKLDSPGPVLFAQNRGGFAGHSFKVYKFRTMAVAEDGASFRQVRRGDARVTRFGGFLRKSSLDEFPQLLNVLFGSMSIVGPRPHPIALDVACQAADIRYQRRGAARPGITGLAQVSGSRGPLDSNEAICRRTDLDVEYVDHWSFQNDLVIIWKTICMLWRHDPQAF